MWFDHESLGRTRKPSLSERAQQEEKKENIEKTRQKESTIPEHLGLCFFSISDFFIPLS
jgi:hypothetical protein